MNSLITENLIKIRDICQSLPVERLVLFGSALKNNLGSNSDIDLLVKFYDEKNIDYLRSYFALKENLEKLFLRKVDLIIEKQFRNPIFSQEVKNNHQLIYDRQNA